MLGFNSQELQEPIYSVYPKGTRAINCRFNRELAVMSRPDFSQWIKESVYKWLEIFDEDLTIEDTFITISFSTLEIIIEVSDRLRLESSDTV